MNRMILVSLLTLAPGAAFSQAPAVPADEVRAEAGQEIGGFDAVRQGLAAEMLLSTEELDAGRRNKVENAAECTGESQAKMCGWPGFPTYRKIE